MDNCYVKQRVTIFLHLAENNTTLSYNYWPPSKNTSWLRTGHKLNAPSEW